MSTKYNIQSYNTTATIPLGSASVLNAATGAGLNGLLRGLLVVPPASLTGSSYIVSVLGRYGETIFEQDTNAAGSNLIINSYANSTNPPTSNTPLQVPLAIPAGNNWLAISVTGDTAAKGTLTSANSGGADVSNNDTVTIGLIAGGSKVYTFKTSLTEVYASATITDGNSSNVVDGNTVVINGRTYRFKDTMLAINDVQIGVDADTSLLNLARAINAGGTPGVEYFIGTTVNADVSASTTVTSHAITLTAKTLGTAGNAITLTRVGSTLTLGNATGGHLNSGVDAIANEIKISGTADGSLTNLKKAINGEATAGTNYSTGTVTHPDVSSAATTSHHIVVTANVEVAAGDSLVTTTTASTLSWGAATLVGSGEAADRLFTVYAYIDRG